MKIFTSCLFVFGILIAVNMSASLLILWALRTLGVPIAYSFQSFFAIWIILVVVNGLFSHLKEHK